MEYDLPPLPKDRSLKFGYTTADMQAYAIAALERQIVPESLSDYELSELAHSAVKDDLHNKSDMKINPADFSVSIVLQNLNSFAPVRTNGVTVTHKPSGLSITETEGRSQHKNRAAAYSKLKTLLIEKGYTE